MTSGAFDVTVSGEARKTFDELGGVRPTVNVGDKLLKGYNQEGKFYWDSDHLRKMAAHFIEVANWLDARARVEEEHP